MASGRTILRPVSRKLPAEHWLLTHTRCTMQTRRLATVDHMSHILLDLEFGSPRGPIIWAGFGGLEEEDLAAWALRHSGQAFKWKWKVNPDTTQPLALASERKFVVSEPSRSILCEPKVFVCELEKRKMEDFRFSSCATDLSEYQLTYGWPLTCFVAVCAKFWNRTLVTRHQTSAAGTHWCYRTFTILYSTHQSGASEAMKLSGFHFLASIKILSSSYCIQHTRTYFVTFRAKATAEKIACLIVGWHATWHRQPEIRGKVACDIVRPNGDRVMKWILANRAVFVLK